MNGNTETAKRIKNNDTVSLICALICLGVGLFGIAGLWGLLILVGLAGLLACAVSRLEQVIRETAHDR